MQKKLIYSVSFVLVLVAVPPVTHAQVVNLLEDPSFEDEIIIGNTAWNRWLTWAAGGAVNSTIEIDTTELVDGGKSLRVNPSGTGQFAVIYAALPLEVGERYTVSFWAKAEAPRTVQARLQAMNNTSMETADFELTTEWAEYTFTAEATNASIKLQIQWDAGVEVPYWLDFVSLYAGEYVAGIEPSGLSRVKAANPDPADGAVDVPREAVLNWTPGEYANTHDVYFGTSFDDVNNATNLDPMGSNQVFRARQDADSYAVDERLDFGQIYYWRIDEVNAPPDATIFKGDVWSFRAEPEGVPLASDLITATASSVESSQIDPNATINGAGLDERSLHNDEKTAMWLCSVDDPEPWIRYDFDKAYRLHEMKVWNHNSDDESTLGYGIQQARIDVYLDTDEQAVIDGTVPATSVIEASYAASVDLGSTYYWRVDEVNDAETPPVWQGDVWSFTTQEYLVVEDFESYNDIEAGQEGSNLVYATWIDGLDNPSANGSTMGYNVAFQPTIETSLVYDGSQSVPLSYNNIVATYSEVTANVADLQAGQDWAEHGIKALTLRFFGDPDNNVQQMYVRLNGTKIAYDGSAEDTRLASWQMWYIDLASIGVNLSNITELAIGFERIGAVGGQGLVLLDGIRLYSYDRQSITPVDPGTAGLQAHYEFEGTTNDSSGNARHGTAMGNPVFEAGRIGQAISFDGLSDYVEITGYKGILGPNPFSITAWINTSDVEGTIMGWGSTAGGTTRVEFRIDADRLRCESSGNVQGNTTLPDNEWIHVAVTVKAGAMIDDPDVTLYLNGQNDTRTSTGSANPLAMAAGYDVTIGRRHTDDSRWLIALIDDVRVYDRALTQEEVTWLAGRIVPFDKPF